MNVSRFHWIIQYKVYHLPFWFVYHYVWWTITIGSPWAAINNILFSPYSIKYCFYAVFQAIGVYTNLYLLIPRLLERGRYYTYIVALLCTIIITAALIVPGYYMGAWLSEKTFLELYGIPPTDYMHLFKVSTLPSTMASITLGMSLKLTKNWIQSRQREQLLQKEKLELEKEKLETELKFLKSQFNPHFLFNTINSIFVLIDKNPRLASESLAKFSDILRYQLYECNEQQIPLQKEIDFIENFIELQKLRQDQENVSFNSNINVHYAGHYTIAPFVLMAFIENAFKHVSKSKEQKNGINLDLTLNDNKLHLFISNTTASEHNGNTFIQQGGIGLTNVKRRLALQYSQKHSLDIQHVGSLFCVTLDLELTESNPEGISIFQGEVLLNNQP